MWPRRSGQLLNPPGIQGGLDGGEGSEGLVAEDLALRRLPAATFAVLTSLAPALAAMAGHLVLDQGLSLAQCAAIALVVTASAGAVRTGSR